MRGQGAPPWAALLNMRLQPQCPLLRHLGTPLGCVHLVPSQRHTLAVPEGQPNCKCILRLYAFNQLSARCFDRFRNSCQPRSPQPDFFPKRSQKGGGGDTVADVLPNRATVPDQRQQRVARRGAALELPQPLAVALGVLILEVLTPVWIVVCLRSVRRVTKGCRLQQQHPALEPSAQADACTCAACSKGAH